LENSDRQLEDRLVFLRSLTQADRDFIAKYGETMWQKWKAMQEFKSIEVSESAKLKESTQARKQRLLAKIEEDILKMESEMKEENEKLGLEDGILEAWSASGFFEVMSQIWDLMVDNMNAHNDKIPNSLTFRLEWTPTKNPNEYAIKMGVVVEPHRKALEKPIE
jgi:hypothetical protein